MLNHRFFYALTLSPQQTDNRCKPNTHGVFGNKNTGKIPYQKVYAVYTFVLELIYH